MSRKRRSLAELVQEDAAQTVERVPIITPPPAAFEVEPPRVMREEAAPAIPQPMQITAPLRVLPAPKPEQEPIAVLQSTPTPEPTPPPPPPIEQNSERRNPKSDFIKMSITVPPEIHAQLQDLSRERRQAKEPYLMSEIVREALGAWLDSGIDR